MSQLILGLVVGAQAWFVHRFHLVDELLKLNWVSFGFGYIFITAEGDVLEAMNLTKVVENIICVLA